ncbi:MAG: autotransporter-associated beta strand repeat-containing protein, partial [Candidatus Accumulibacter sp.]|nr:autotransporter-associated beta strand repeat-containing protein [Accumulibacter sp.]
GGGTLLNSSGLTAQSGEFGGAISGSGGLTKTGSGTLTLTGTNAYTGGTVVGGGTLAGNITSGGNLTVSSGATYDGTNASRVIDALNGGGIIKNTNGLTAQSGEFGGTIDATNSGGLTKTGSGTLTLTGENAYTGDTIVSEGRLKLTGTLESSSIVVGDDSVSSSSSARSLSSLAAPMILNEAVIDPDPQSPTLILSETGQALQDVTLSSGATLIAYGGASIGENLRATDANLYFWLPEGHGITAPVLAVGDTATLTNVRAMKVFIPVSLGALDAGERVTLLRAATSLSFDPDRMPAGDMGTPDGGMVEIDFDRGFTGQGKLLAYQDGKDLVVALKSAGGDGKPRAKALSEGHLAGMAFLRQGADFLIDQGIAAALRQTEGAGRTGLTGFAVAGGGKLRYETGSHIDVEGGHLIAGLGLARPIPAGELTLGGFIEHGGGRYDTQNRFPDLDSVRGKGEVDYTGAGLFAHLKAGETKRGHGYAEVSARFGKVEADFKTRDLTDEFTGARAAYDSAAPYAGAHVGAGYQWERAGGADLNLYTRYLRTRQGSDTVRLPNGEPVKFEAVDSRRVSLGATWRQTLTPSTRAYLGVAWEHEYDGRAKAIGNGVYRLAIPDLRGNTTRVEVGLTVTPGPAQPLSLDFGIQGYAGKREGVTGSFRLNYRF